MKRVENYVVATVPAAKYLDEIAERSLTDLCWKVATVKEIVHSLFVGFPQTVVYFDEIAECSLTDLCWKVVTVKEIAHSLFVGFHRTVMYFFVAENWNVNFPDEVKPEHLHWVLYTELAFQTSIFRLKLSAKP